LSINECYPFNRKCFRYTPKKFDQVLITLLLRGEKIVEELNSVQGKPVDIKGYYHASEDRIFDVMRPSETLNGIIQTMLS